MAKKKKNSAGAASKTKKAKRSKQKAKGAQQAAQAPPAPAQQPRPQSWSGGVPPADAFDNVRRFPQPEWQREQERQRRAQQSRQTAPGKGGGKKGSKKQKVGGAQGASGAKSGAGGKKRPPQKRKTANPARRRRQRRLATLLAIVVLIAVGVWFSITVLFKINRYEVQGEGVRYSEEEIIAAFGHSIGDNLFGFSVKNAQERLETSLPYIEVADIRRRPPSTVQFRLTMAEEAYYLQWEEGFVILNSKGKVLRVTADEPTDLVRIDGLSSLVIETGKPIGLDKAANEAAIAAKKAEEAEASALAESAAASLSDTSEVEEPDEPESALDEEDDTSVPEEGDGDGGDDAEGDGETGAEPEPQPEAPAADPEVAAESFEVLWILLEALDESGLEEISWLDVSDPLELGFGWQDRIRVKLGPKGGMDEKLRALVVLLTDPSQGIDEGDRGTFDLTMYLTTGECIFTPE